MFNAFDQFMNRTDNHIDLNREYDFDNMDCMDYDTDSDSEDNNKIVVYIKSPNNKKPIRKLDSVVSSVIEKFEARARFGQQKYGTDLDREDLTFLDWIQHAQEEHMDAILYLEKIKQMEETRLASTSSETTVYLYLTIYVLMVLCLVLSMNHIFEKLPV